MPNCSGTMQVQPAPALLLMHTAQHADSRVLQAWIEKQSSYLKSIDGNHLVTVGACCHACSNVAALITVYAVSLSQRQLCIALMAPQQCGAFAGEEGFWSSQDCNSQANPASWAGSTGQSFGINHAAPGIDYAAIHLWPHQLGTSLLVLAASAMHALVTACLQGKVSCAASLSGHVMKCCVCLRSAQISPLRSIGCPITPPRPPRCVSPMLPVYSC